MEKMIEVRQGLNPTFYIPYPYNFNAAAPDSWMNTLRKTLENVLGFKVFFASYGDCHITFTSGLINRPDIVCVWEKV